MWNVVFNRLSGSNCRIGAIQQNPRKVNQPFTLSEVLLQGSIVLNNAIPFEHSKSHAGWNAYAPSMLSADDRERLSRQRRAADAACWAPGTLGTRHWQSWEVCRGVRWLSWLIEIRGEVVLCRVASGEKGTGSNEWRNALFR